jgi:hypothetical protein
MTMRDPAEFLKVTERTIDPLAAKSQLPFFKVGVTRGSDEPICKVDIGTNGPNGGCFAADQGKDRRCSD